MENTKTLIAQVNIIESGKVSQKQHLNFQKLVHGLLEKYFRSIHSADGTCLLRHMTLKQASLHTHITIQSLML
jgi:hypothetical protein